MTEIIDCLSDYKLNEEPKVVAQVDTDDPSTQYTFVDINKPSKKNYNEMLGIDNIDYEIPRDEDAKRRGFKEDLPISFLSIKDGEVDLGKSWYMKKFPKLPEPMAELMARYNWGDLKYQTKKKIKNDKKKCIKKGKNYEPLAFTIKSGRFVVNFD